MVQVVQILRRDTAGAPGGPLTLVPGQLAYNQNGQQLFVGDGTNVVQQLVGIERQVETSGDQSVAGAKTFSGAVVFTGTATADVAKLKVPAATALAGQVLSTDGPTGNLSFITLPAGAVPAVPATDAEMDAGTRNDVFGTPLNTRSLIGASITTLTTTATTIVPAINELKTMVDALALDSQFVGTIDAAAAGVAWATPPGGTADTLPPASAANDGWYLICDTAGSTVAANVPPGTYDIGDWIISNGTAWTHLEFGGISSVTASQVGVAPSVAGGSNVQTALEGLENANTAQDALIAGFVTGPATSVLDRIATYSDVTGKVIKDSGTLVADLVTTATFTASQAAQDAIIATKGDVVGPAASVGDNLAAFNLTTGKLIKDSGMSLAGIKSYVDTAMAALVVVTDTVSIVGNGTAATPLEVALIDCGTY